MKLTIHDDGFGYTPEGVRYWRDWNGCWLRVVRGQGLYDVTSNGGWVSGTTWQPGRIMLRYGSDDFVYEIEAA